MSRKRLFHRVSEEQIKNLQEVKMKKRSFSKMKWAVNAYQEWRENRLSSTEGYDEVIFRTNLDDLVNLTKDDLEYCLCRFVPEVSKKNGKGDFPGSTLYQLCVAIQAYLKHNKIYWKLVEGPDFKDLRIVLDNVMKQRAEANVGTTKRQADLVSYEHEEKLWSDGILGEQTPDQLRDTVCFLLGINLALRAVDEHYHLRRDTKDKPSQLSFQRNSNGVRCLVYTEDTCTKTNNGGLKHMRKDRKIVWVYPNKNVNRCCVRLVDKYISLCPPTVKKSNFYLRSLEKINPAQWYGHQVLGQNRVGEVVKNLLKSAKLDGYFINHSLRRTGTTCLFQAGFERKLIKEFTGHVSDAVDAYAITSDAQRQVMSEILAKAPTLNNVHVDESKPKDQNCNGIDVNITTKSATCTCNCSKTSDMGVSQKGEEVCKMIKNIIDSGKNTDIVINISIELKHK